MSRRASPRFQQRISGCAVGVLSPEAGFLATMPHLTPWRKAVRSTWNVYRTVTGSRRAANPFTPRWMIRGVSLLRASEPMIGRHRFSATA